MTKKLALRTAKLSSEPHKLKTISNISATFEHQPADPDERKHGIIFAVVDISGDAKKTEELLDIILDTFHGEYYQDIKKDPLDSFENALAKINEELGEYTNQGNTYWMGKLNAILAVYSQNTIHLTQAGKAEGYLYRGGKQSHISNDLAGDKVNPLRTFINITSGEITDGDKVAIVSSGVLSACSPDEIFKYVEKYHPKIAISHIADIVDKSSGIKGKNAAIVMEFLTTEALANETLEDEPDEIWLKGTRTKEMLAEQTGNILQKVFKYIKIGTVALSDFTVNSILPTLEKGYFFIKRESINAYKKYIKKEEPRNVLIDTEEEIEGFEEESIFEKRAEVEPQKTTSSYKSEIHIKESDEAPRKAKLEKTKNTILNNLGSFYGSATKLVKDKRPKKYLRKLGKIKNIKKSYFLITGILIVAVAVPFFLVAKNNQKEADVKAKETAVYETIDQKVSEADSLVKSNQKLKAIEALEDASKLAESMLGSKYFSDEAKGKLGEINSRIDKLSGTKRVAAATFVTLPDTAKSDILGLYSISEEFYVVTKSGEIFKIDKDTKKATRINTNGQIEGNAVSATALSKIRTIEILTDKPMVYEFDLDADSISEKTVSNSWEKSGEIDSFETNLYLLSKDRNQIYKYLRTSGGYGSSENYISDGTAPQNISSFKVDSDIYILANGKVLKYTAGEKQNFSLKGLLIKLDEADSLYTDGNTDKLLALSKTKNYIAVFGKDGNYKGKYVSDSFKDIQNIFISENTVYVVLKDKILSFSI